MRRVQGDEEGAGWQSQCVCLGSGCLEDLNQLEDQAG